MGRRPGLSINDRNIALGMLEGGARARRFGCNERNYRLQQRVRQTDSVNDRARSGRLHITTPREDRYMSTLSHRHRFMPATGYGDRDLPEIILPGTDSGLLGFKLDDHTNVRRVTRFDWQAVTAVG